MIFCVAGGGEVFNIDGDGNILLVFQYRAKRMMVRVMYTLLIRRFIEYDVFLISLAIRKGADVEST